MMERDGRREVTPAEQHVHGMLEQALVAATTFLIALHWDQARSLGACGRRAARFQNTSEATSLAGVLRGRPTHFDLASDRASVR
jgi:hypothetical protein